jgi:HK97 family phage major capsid protein
MENVRELMHQRAANVSQARALIDTAEKENRGLSAEEEKTYTDLTSKAEGLTSRIDRLTSQADLERRAGTLQHDVARPDPTIGMGARDVQRYSFMRALRAQANRDWRGAELEREASDATSKALGMNPKGFFVPLDVLASRPLARVLTPRGWRYVPDLQADMTKSPVTAGGNLIATDLLSASFIELLRNKMVLQAMGATILGDLVGDVAIPKQTGGATAYWIAANSDIDAESTPTVGQVALTPHTVGSYTDISRSLLKQSSIDAEQFVRNDLSATVALAIDRAGIHGATYAPDGILATTGIGAVYAGGAADDNDNANGAAPSWADVINLETEVASDNADIGTLAYLTNAKMRGKMKQTVKVAGTSADFLWDKGPDPLNGYPAFVSNQVSSILSKGASGAALSALIFGNWADVLIGMWGTLDVLSDPYTGDLAGRVRVIVLQDVDIDVRNAESFAAGDDFVTA